MNNTFWEFRSKVNITGLLSDLGTLTATTLSILGLLRWNKNWNVRNSYSYVATATKIRFHVATWKFSDFCSRHTEGVAGDGIMFHILVCLCVCFVVMFVWTNQSTRVPHISGGGCAFVTLHVTHSWISPSIFMFTRALPKETYTYHELWPWRCVGWYDIAYLSRFVSDIYSSCKVQDSLYYDMDIGTMWHCALGAIMCFCC